MNSIIGFLWFFRVAKNFSFYLYLWQLKEYHFYRFKAHFETKEGRKIIFNNIFFAKIILVIFYFFSFISIFYSLFIFLLFFLYLFQFLKLVFDIVKKDLKLPVFTKKIFFLISILFLISVIFFVLIFSSNNFFIYILIFDILSPVIISFIVLFFQPLTFLIRSRIMEKAKRKRNSFKNLIVIGITGSYGKTSTKEFLYTLLSQRFNVLKTSKHVNSEIGISNIILEELNSAHQIFICEMGAYRKGGIKLLSEIIKPNIGILTGVNQQHLSLFGKMEKLFSAEGGLELYEYVKDDGFMVINGDSNYVQNIYSGNKSKKTYFSSCKENNINDEEVAIFCDNLVEEEESLSCDILIERLKPFNIKVDLLGKQNMENLLLSIFTSYKLGLTLEEIKKGLLEIKREQGGINFIKNEKDFKIIDVTYSSNPNSVIALLDYLKVFSDLHKTIIMPCLIELGRSSKKVHRRIGNKIGEVCDLGIITTKDYFKNIKEGADINKNNIIYSNNSKEIARKIKEKRGVVLLKGRLSKKIIEELKEINN